MLVIGLETHIRLNTRSKIYARSKNCYSTMPNQYVDALDLGLPGTLPVLNAEVVKKAVTLGIVLNMQVSRTSVIDRKSYSYPDLPKGYQLSQEHLPLLTEGFLEIDLPGGMKKKVRIKKAHIEEDAAKLVRRKNMLDIDYNRSGAPLLEVVTYPDLTSSLEVTIFLKKLLMIAKHIGVTDGHLEQGCFRSDVNISLLKDGAPGIRSEVKNLNSFRHIEQAIAYEAERQLNETTLIQESRGFCEETGRTYSMRNKENALDYRYYPDPDSPVIVVSDEYIQKIKDNLPIMPEERAKQYSELRPLEIKFLMDNPDAAEYYDRSLEHVDQKTAFTWIFTHLKSLTDSFNKVPLIVLVQVIRSVQENKISKFSGKKALAIYLESQQPIDDIVRDLSSENSSDTLDILIQEVLRSNIEAVTKFKTGDSKAIFSLVGKAMKITEGKFDPGLLHLALLRIINDEKQ